MTIFVSLNSITVIILRFQRKIYTYIYTHTINIYSVCARVCLSAVLPVKLRCLSYRFSRALGLGHFITAKEVERITSFPLVFGDVGQFCLGRWIWCWQGHVFDLWVSKFTGRRHRIAHVPRRVQKLVKRDRNPSRRGLASGIIGSGRYHEAQYMRSPIKISHIDDSHNSHLINQIVAILLRMKY